MLGGHLAEWLDIGLRWLHIVAGAAWIGTSFYFNFLNNSLRPPAAGDGRVDGELWAVHGGGFYRVEHYAVAPERLPEKLHWFKWEAYATWLSGGALLILVYYLGPGGILVDPAVADISRATATVIGVGTLVLGWFVYDRLCRSRLMDRPAAFGTVSFALVTLVAFGLSQVLAGRAAYIHVGALLGTLMAGNVFAIIIPSQREMVAAMEEQRDPDAAVGAHAARRSLHNNYMTLPVLFIMVSNHFPTTYGSGVNWAVLAGIALAGAGIRHWFNLRGQGRRNAYLLPAAAILLVALAFVTVPRTSPGVVVDEEVTQEEAFAIVQSRCVACHSVNPSHAGFAAPPKGIAFDTPEEMLDRIEDIQRVAVDTRVMPLGNATGMTDEERARLGAWIASRTD